MTDYGYIARNYSKLLAEIRQYEEIYGRKITLVAVTKSGSDEELLELAKAGVTDVGENRPSELSRRSEILHSQGYYPTLHEIGNIQRNKVKLVLSCADLVHSIGSVSLAEEMSKQAKKLGIRVKVLVEINSAAEESKGGFLPEEAEAAYLKIKEMDALDIVGIMTMGPVAESQEQMRPYFKLTKRIFDTIKDKYGFDGEGILSMGMSNSYRVAIEEGSTLVRVGRKLFDKNEGR